MDDPTPDARWKMENHYYMLIGKKRKRYPEFSNNESRAKLIVFGVEVGGRWSIEATKFLSTLAKAKSLEELPHLRQSAFAMWHRRWSGMIGIAAQRALACSLLRLPEIHGAAGNLPFIDDVLAEGRYSNDFGGIEDECIDYSICNTILAGGPVHPYPGGGRLNTPAPSAPEGQGAADDPAGGSVED